MTEARKIFHRIVEDFFKKMQKDINDLNQQTLERADKILNILKDETIDDIVAMKKCVNIIVIEVFKEKTNDSELANVFKEFEDKMNILDKIKKSKLN